MSSPVATAQAPTAAAVRANLEWAAAVCGIVFAVLAVIGLGIPPRPPGPGSAVQAFSDYFADHRVVLLAAFYINTLSDFFFILFVGGLWATLRRVEPNPAWLSVLALAGGVGAALLAAAGNAFWGAAAWRADSGIPPHLARALFDLGGPFYMPWLPLTVFFTAMAALILTTNVLPRLLGWVAVTLTPLFLLSRLPFKNGARDLFTLGNLAVWLIWTVAIAVILMRRARRAEAA